MKNINTQISRISPHSSLPKSNQASLTSSIRSLFSDQNTYLSLFQNLSPDRYVKTPQIQGTKSLEKWFSRICHLACFQNMSPNKIVNKSPVFWTKSLEKGFSRICHLVWIQNPSPRVVRNPKQKKTNLQFIVPINSEHKNYFHNVVKTNNIFKKTYREKSESIRFLTMLDSLKIHKI